MKHAPCPRLFEVAAASDGRITGAERESLERHLGVCVECSQEAQALAALTEAVRALPAGERDALHVRRERNRLLAAFDRELRPQAGALLQARTVRRLLWPALSAALLGSLLLFWRFRPLPPENAARVAVRGSSSALWSERTEGLVDQVRLERGSLWVHVDHSSTAGRRLLVLLPDGELEDIGTTFTVSVEEGRTTHVAVQDGSVVLRVRDQSAVPIGAGETWSPPIAPAAVRPPASGVSPVEPLPSAKMLVPAQPAPSSRPSSRLARSPRPLTAQPAPDPAADFRSATAALGAGDNLGAAAAFASFLREHPRDARAEDAAYLRVIALQRSGDPIAMKQAARDYLQRYPTGFRHTELEKLSR